MTATPFDGGRLEKVEPVFQAQLVLVAGLDLLGQQLHSAGFQRLYMAPEPGTGQRDDVQLDVVREFHHRHGVLPVFEVVECDPESLLLQGAQRGQQPVIDRNVLKHLEHDAFMGKRHDGGIVDELPCQVDKDRGLPGDPFQPDVEECVQQDL